MADSLSRYYKFHWQGHCYAYRSTYSEDYVAWDIDPNESEWHNTHKILNSGWVADLEKDHDPNDFPKLHHFVLCTSDYVIEVLSEEEPLIQQWVVPSEKPPTEKYIEEVTGSHR